MFEIIQGDCLESLRRLPDDHVNCVVTSPPYWGLRDYGASGQIGREATPDEYVSKMVEVFREVRRVLKPDGTCWINLGDTYAANRGYQVPSTKGGKKHAPAQGFEDSGMSVPDGLKAKDLVGIPWSVAFALRADGWWLRQDIIWHKPNAMPESVTDRCTKAHEYLFLLTKSTRYYFKNIREPMVYPERRYNPDTSKHKTAGLKEQGNRSTSALHDGRTQYGNPELGRNKRSVWSISTQPFKGAHCAPFPPNLVEPCILGGCPEDGLVLDPFCGSGTVGVVAMKHGRKFLGLELNPEYAEMSRNRISSSCTETVQIPPADDWLASLES